MASAVDASELAQLAQSLRRAPKAVRDAIKVESRAKIAEPVAGRIRSAASGPYARILAPGTKAQAGSGAEARIKIGGLSPKVSGRAGPRQVVFGVEFGGGKRLSKIAAGRGHRGYRRYSTRQFVRHKAPFIWPTVHKNADAIEEAYAEIVLDALHKEVS